MTCTGIRKLYWEMTDRVMVRLQSPILLIMRLYWGYGFISAGTRKFGHVEQITGFFASIGIPFPTLNVYLVASIETVGGFLLMLGLGSRIAAIPLTVVMVVAYVTAHWESLLVIFSDPSEFIAQEPFLFLLTLLLVIAFGPGRYSVDHLLSKRFQSGHNCT